MRYDHCFSTSQSVYLPPLDLSHLTVVVADTRTSSCPNLTPFRQRAAVQSAGERSAFTLRYSEHLQRQALAIHKPGFSPNNPRRFRDC